MHAAEFEVFNMHSAMLFESAIDWLRENYEGHRFYAERDIVWTVQTQLNKKIEELNLPYQVFNDYTIESRVRVDLAILNSGIVEVVAEFKYEPSRARSTDNGGDIIKTKFPVVFWSEIEKDIGRIQGFVQNGQAKAGYSVFIDEGSYFSGRSANPAEWQKWDGSVSALWLKLPNKGN